MHLQHTLEMLCVSKSCLWETGEQSRELGCFRSVCDSKCNAFKFFFYCFWSKTSVKQRRWELWGAGCQLGAELGANPPGEGLDLRFLSALGILTFTSSQGLGRGFSRLIVQLGDVSQPCSPG